MKRTIFLLAVMFFAVRTKAPQKLETAGSSSCGGPPIYCATTSTNIVPITKLPPPTVDAKFLDPDFHSAMVRVTGPDTLTSRPGISYLTNSSAEQNTWNIDSTKFYAIASGNAIYAYDFNSTTMDAMLEPLALPLSTASFSRVNANLVYGWTGGTSLTIGQYDLATHKLTDVIATPSCVPGLTPQPHQGDVSVSANDQRIMVYEGGSQPDRDDFVVVYDKTLGCRWLNTQTGEIGGAWGPKGKATPYVTPFLMHNARLAISGQWAVLDPSTMKTRVIWTVDSLNVRDCSFDSTDMCAGHGVGGYQKYVNPSNYLDDMNIVIRPFDTLTPTSPLIKPLPKPVQWGYDKHLSWNDDTSTDTMPVCGSTYLEFPPDVPRAWNDEIICLRTDGTAHAVWRFAHHRSVYQTVDFWSTPRGNVSQDGKFYEFTSTWENELGVQPGTPRIFRKDVFVVELH